MSTLSQSIPNFLSGISQQPDNRKRPGQVKDAVNAFPDFALGMLKRPGGKFVSKLHGASASGKWFEILRDETEKYIAQFDDNVFRVWDLTTGDTKMVDMGSDAGVPGTCNTTTVKTKSDAFKTAKDDVASKLALLQAAGATLSQAIAAEFDTEEEFFETQYTYTDDVEETLVSGVALNSAGIHLVKEAGTVVSNTSSMPANYTLGTERTDENLLLASKGYRVFTVYKTTAATNTPAKAASQTAYDTAKTNYDNAVTALATAQSEYDTAVANCAITSPAGYLNGATADDIEVLTLNDSTFVLNKKKVVALKADLTHATGMDEFRAQVTITVVANNTDYIINLDGTDYNHTSHSSSATSDGIAQGLATAINGNAGFTAIAIGSGVYITKASSFNIHVSAAGVSAETMFVITTSTSNTSQLPLESKDGYVLKIVNSLDIDVDDMYLRFETDNGASTGRGQWFEDTAPGIKYKFDEQTMPHRLISQANGTFTFESISWDDRAVGDNNTNPIPSFVDFEIDHLFFYRNRLGFLSGQNVVLSKAGDLFDFWNTTAQTATDDDPIDISVASKKSVFLHYVQPTSVGLVLYSSNEQFLLSTDSDILSPKTAKVNTMSSYECDPNINAQSLGISQAFISKTPLYTRVFELTDISTDTPPLMSDITNYVPELIPQSVDSLKVSPALSIVSLGEVGKADIYQYRFLNRTREERAVNSWYRWELSGTLLTQFFDSSTWYAVVKNGTDVYVQSFDVTQSNEQGFLTLPTGEKTDVCLDLFSINPHRTYDSSTDKTRVFLPYDNVTGRTFTVVALGNFIGGSSNLSSASVGAVLTPTVAGSAGSQHADINGDFRGKNLIIGCLYDMTIDLPTLYNYNISDNNISNDDVSSLIIHRLKVKTGLSGPVDYKVSITGINDYTNTVTVTMPQQYNLNNVNMQASSTHVVPIFQRNENLAIQIIGNTPFPVSLLGLDWEGKLNQRFYRRR